MSATPQHNDQLHFITNFYNSQEVFKVCVCEFVPQKMSR